MCDAEVFGACWSFLKRPVFHQKMLIQWNWGILLALTGQVCWKKSFQPPLSGLFFPLGPTCGGCSGLFGWEASPAASSGWLWTHLAMREILTNSVSILPIVFLLIPTFGRFLTAGIWFWYRTKSSFTPCPSSLQFWKWGISAGWKFWPGVCPFTKLPWILMEQSSQQATTGAAVWTLDWQSNSKGVRCTKILLNVGIGIPISEWQSRVPGPWSIYSSCYTSAASESFLWVTQSSRYSVLTA